MLGNSRIKIWILSVLGLAVLPMSLFLVVYFIDYHFTGYTKNFTNIFDLFKRMSVGDARQIMGGMGEVIAAILGIVITVASIIVQLAATRYTPRITEMFFKDRKNLLIMAFFVVSAVYCLWINYAIRGGSSASLTFIPVTGSLINVFLLTVSLWLIAPYFLYVFYFLDPSNIVKRIEEQAVHSIAKHHSDVSEVQLSTVDAIEQLTDIAMNALEQKDKGLANSSINALKDLVDDYYDMKASLDLRWYEISGKLRNNTDFVSMHREVLNDISSQKTWLEYKILRQYQMIYNEALNKMRDIDYIIAINTRYIGEKSLFRDDIHLLKLVIKFFNTYLRSTLNAKDIRTAYNILHQYRLFAEAILRSGNDDQLLEVAGYFKYYGQLAFNMNISFITETVAYDLTSLCELAFSTGAAVGDELLGVLLEVDKEAEDEQQERSLRGVRKAQIKMATYFLLQGDKKRTERIFMDMRHEPAHRINSIREELMSIESKDFWEVIDRGENFDYLPPERKRLLNIFFAKFENI